MQNDFGEMVTISLFYINYEEFKSIISPAFLTKDAAFYINYEEFK